MVRLDRSFDAGGAVASSVTQGGRSERSDCVAVVGSGVAGLSAAWHLERAGCRTVLFESDRRFGGHAHTVDLSLPDHGGHAVTHGVDTGFLVFNQRTYPGLISWFDALGVACAASDMSFSVQSPGLGGSRGRLEWSGSNLDALFAQRRNLASPRFLAMLAQVLRFNRLGTALARGGGADADPDAMPGRETVASFLSRHRFSRDFRDGYLLPMIACIWSCPVEQMLEFPVATLLRFCDNHGLMQVNDRPPWFTVRGGSRCYVDAVIASLPDVRAGEEVLHVRRHDVGVRVDTARGSQSFGAVVLACHAPQALALLGADATRDERAVLGAMRTQPNRAVLHTDSTVMPTTRRAWAAWNFERSARGQDGPAADVMPVRRGAAPQADQPPRGTAGTASVGVPVCVHYWINRLQPLPFAQDVFVSLNPCREPDASKVIADFEYAHPVFDLAALEAQARVLTIQGPRQTWFAGAWCGYGFHEDGFQAGLRAARGAAAWVRSRPLDRAAA